AKRFHTNVPSVSLTDDELTALRRVGAFISVYSDLVIRADDAVLTAAFGEAHAGARNLFCMNDLGVLWHDVGVWDRELQRDPSALNYWLRGSAFFDVRLYRRAIADLDEAIRRQPDAQRLRKRGIAHLAVGQDDEAQADFGEAIHLAPNTAVALWTDVGQF